MFDWNGVGVYDTSEIRTETRTEAMTMAAKLQTFWETIKDFVLRYVVEPFRHFGPFDLLDILLLTVLLYALYRFAKTRRAGRKQELIKNI